MSTQITIDAELGTKYEDSGDSFDYPMLLEGGHFKSTAGAFRGGQGLLAAIWLLVGA
jgi:hypothetical protein